MRNANVNSGPALAGGGTVRKSAAVEVVADNEDRQTRGLSHCGATLTLVWESANSANVRRRTGVQWREVGESSEEKEGEPTSSEMVEDDEVKEREVEANEVEENEVGENEAEVDLAVRLAMVCSRFRPSAVRSSTVDCGTAAPTHQRRRLGGGAQSPNTDTYRFFDASDWRQPLE